MVQGSLTTTDIRAALQRVLATERFRQSPQLSAFLTYVVERALEGQAYAIKGYTIATEVFGRSVDFDPQADPIVRVEARRLRQLLAAYYEGPGGADGIEIKLPLGGYAPRFLQRRAGKADLASAQAVAAQTVAAPAGSREAEADGALVTVCAALTPPQTASVPTISQAAVSAARSQFVWPLLFALIAGLAVSLALVFSPVVLHSSPGEQTVQRTAALPSPGPSFRGDLYAPVIAVMPFRVLGMPPAGDDTAMRLTERLQDALARFDEMRVMTAEEWGKGSARAASAATLYPDYRLDGRLIWRLGHKASLAVTLVDVPTSEILFAWEFEDVLLDTRGEAGPGGIAESDALRSIVSQIAQPYGMMFARWTGYASYSRSGRSSCLFATFEFWRGTAPAESTARLRPCLDALIARGEETPGVLALQAMVDAADYGAGRLSEAKLENAVVMAKKAVAMAPTSARGHQILMNVLFFRGEAAPALEAGRRAIALNPYDSDILADVGARLVAKGRYEEGLQQLKRAVQFTAVRPARQDFYLFLGSLMLNERQAALDYAAAIDDVDSVYARLARCLAAVEKRDMQAAKREVGRLVTILPDLARDPRATLGRWRFAPDILDRLIEGLHAAGLENGLRH